jgi:hypothetical protein
MSIADGMAALNLQMPDRVPRTEYSVESHWELIRIVTGLDVAVDSPPEIQLRARQAFMKVWNYGFVWNVLVGGGVFGEKRTHMGHAVYTNGGTDYDARVDSLFDDPEKALRLDPFELYGTKDKRTLVADFDRHYDEACAYSPDAVAMTGIYVTGMSGLIEIFGWETLLEAAGTDPEAFGALMFRYADWIRQYFDALAECKAPVVMVHDDIVWTSGAFFAPAWYRRFLFPSYHRCFEKLLQSGKRVLYTSDGNFTEFIDDIAACGIHGFVMEPSTDMAYIAAKYGKTHAFVGNADTRILLSGTKAEIYAEVQRCMDIGKHCPGFFLAVGNHLPTNTPVDNALWYNEAYEKLGRR